MGDEKWAVGEIVIELTGKQNGSFAFPPTGQTLRGRFNVQTIRQTSSNTEYDNMPVVPGIHLCMDAKRRAFRVVDVLGFPENKDLVDEINRIVEPWQGKGKPEATTVRENQTDTEVKSLLWQMGQFVWSGKAEEVHGAFPSKDKVLAMPGHLQLRWNYVPQGQSKYATRDELDYMGAPPEAEAAAPPRGRAAVTA